MIIKTPKPSLLAKALITSLALLVLIAILLTGLELTNTIHLFHKTARSTGDSTTKGETVQAYNNSPAQKSVNSPATNNTTPTTQPGDQKSPIGSNDTTTNIVAPSGDFVSAHKVSLGTPITSVCNTTPGVSCKITFTNVSGAVKSLAQETTDRGGAAYWNNWTPESIGLTTGSWQIQAIASSDGQAKTSADKLSLVVSR